MDDIETLEFDRFELLSAYLDGETTASERKQVEAWLTADPEFNHCYQQLLQMQRGLQSAPIPVSVPVEQTIAGVMARIDRQPQPKRLVLATVGTVAAVAIAAITGLLSGNGSLDPKTAQTEMSNPTVAIKPAADILTHADLMVAIDLKPSDLMIDIDRSPVDIPLASNVSSPDAP